MTRFSSRSWRASRAVANTSTKFGVFLAGWVAILFVAFPDASRTTSQESAASAATQEMTPRQRWEALTPEQRKRVKQRFERLQPLGEGGSAEVVCALDKDIGRKVALKRLHRGMRTPEMLARFVEEIRTTGKLEHPNIVPIHDVGVDAEGNYYFVMKYVEGETLQQIISCLQRGDPDYHQRYGFEQRLQLFSALLDAVAFAHSRGVVHRDIKPSNVMVGVYGEVMLMDWGIAMPMGEGEGEAGAVDPSKADAADQPADDQHLLQTRAGGLVGTPAYMSPEQARGEPVDFRSDIYSLCVMFHELLCLRHYLSHRNTLSELVEGVQEQKAPLASAVKNPHQRPVPMDLTWFLKKGLHKDPGQRYQSVREMIQRLDKRAEGNVPVECHITLLKRTTGETLRFVDRHPMISTVGTLMALAGLVSLALLGN